MKSYAEILRPLSGPKKPKQRPKKHTHDNLMRDVPRLEIGYNRLEAIVHNLESKVDKTPE